MYDLVIVSVQRFSVILERRLGSAFWLLVLVFLTLPATAEIHSPASERFTDVRGAEVPDFQRHVVPLIGRLGCNGRSCHGSFQGQGGFQLSLFGYTGIPQDKEEEADTG